MFDDEWWVYGLVVCGLCYIFRWSVVVSWLGTHWVASCFCVLSRRFPGYGFLGEVSLWGGLFGLDLSDLELWGLGTELRVCDSSEG